MSFPLYATRNEVGRYTCEPGMRHVGNLVLELPPGWSQGLARANDYNLQVGVALRHTSAALISTALALTARRVRMLHAVRRVHTYQYCRFTCRCVGGRVRRLTCV